MSRQNKTNKIFTVKCIASTHDNFYNIAPSDINKICNAFQERLLRNILLLTFYTEKNRKYTVHVYDCGIYKWFCLNQLSDMLGDKIYKYINEESIYITPFIIANMVQVHNSKVYTSDTISLMRKERKYISIETLLSVLKEMAIDVVNINYHFLLKYVKDVVECMKLMDHIYKPDEELEVTPEEALPNLRQYQEEKLERMNPRYKNVVNNFGKFDEIRSKKFMFADIPYMYKHIQLRHNNPKYMNPESSDMMQMLFWICDEATQYIYDRTHDEFFSMIEVTNITTSFRNGRTTGVITVESVAYPKAYPRYIAFDLTEICNDKKHIIGYYVILMETFNDKN